MEQTTSASAILTINGVEYVTKNSETATDLSNADATFLKIGKVYLIRTVTMIYTGRLKDQSKTELLLSEAAWIAETERWADTCKNEAFKEVEPYYRDVILFKGAILDVTEISKPQLIQK